LEIFLKLKIRIFEYFLCQRSVKIALGTYVARHSFSSRLMRKGASTQYIKESLGHSSAAVTESYLGDFMDNVKEEYAILLTDFS
jgi:integrase/recombinase XerD